MIPTGHDKPLPRSALRHTPSLLTPLVPSPHPSHTLSPLSTSTEPSREFQDLEHCPYQPFFHMYKPVTKYKKSNPPPPDFRIVVVKYAYPPLSSFFNDCTDLFVEYNSGTTTPMPTLFEFTEMFSSVPFTPGENTLLPPPPVQRAIGSGPAPKPRPTRPPRPSNAHPPTRLESILCKIPYVSNWIEKGKKPKKGKPSPYPRLKTGRRSILVAVVNDGTSSILRFSETEFGKLPWKGQGRSQ